MLGLTPSLLRDAGYKKFIGNVGLLLLYTLSNTHTHTHTHTNMRAHASYACKSKMHANRVDTYIENRKHIKYTDLKITIL